MRYPYMGLQIAMLSTLGLGALVMATDASAGQLPDYTAPRRSVVTKSLHHQAAITPALVGQPSQCGVHPCMPKPKPTCKQMCIPLAPGENVQEAIQRVEKKQNCVVRTITCIAAWKVDLTFLRASEGPLFVNGYVPQCKPKKGVTTCKINGRKYKKGEVIGVSGVTISTGVDLGQQSYDGTKAIIKDYISVWGNFYKVDVGALMKKLKPYFGKKKQKAVDALDETPLTIIPKEAVLLESAFEFDVEWKSFMQFDHNAKYDMEFRALPSAAQTVIVDFAYQYGMSDKHGVREKFWAYVYDGEWKKLVNWLGNSKLPYHHRRLREAKLLQSAIDGKMLPKAGNPCSRESY